MDKTFNKTVGKKYVCPNVAYVSNLIQDVLLESAEIGSSAYDNSMDTLDFVGGVS